MHKSVSSIMKKKMKKKQKNMNTRIEGRKTVVYRHQTWHLLSIWIACVNKCCTRFIELIDVIKIDVHKLWLRFVYLVWPVFECTFNTEMAISDSIGVKDKMNTLLHSQYAHTLLNIFFVSPFNNITCVRTWKLLDTLLVVLWTISSDSIWAC